MSNSPLVDYVKISPNRTKGRKHKIDTVTIHCVVGQLSVETLGNVFAPSSRKASSNYGIGPDGRIGMYCEEKDRSWCSSNSDNDNRAITIEVASETSPPYAVTDEAYRALIRLLADICERNNIKELRWRGDKSLVGQIKKQNMTVHRWFANKDCPGDYLYERHGQIAKEVNDILSARHIAEYEIGHIVDFTGTQHYASTNAEKGKPCKPGKAWITSVYTTGKHPVHLVAVTGGGSNVYGWVDTAFIHRESVTLAVGDKVKVKQNAKTYTGGKLSSFVYKNTYDVIQIKDDRVVIGVGKAVTAAVNIKDIILL